MHLRTYVGGLLVPLWALLLSGAVAAENGTEASIVDDPSATESSSPPTRPNIIVMQPDDFAFMDEWTPPPDNPDGSSEQDGFPPSGLPNLERLRTGGLQMMQAYTTSPVCGTSRYSTITGKYPSRAASVREGDNNSDDPSYVVIPTTKLIDTEEQKDCSTENLAATLKDAGYQTAMFGKWHLSRFTDDTYSYQAGVETVKSCGFDTVGGLYVENMGGRADYFADGSFAHNMEWVTWEAIKFLNETSQTQDTPFFMYFNPTVPHSHVNLEDSLSEFSCRDTPDRDQEWDSDPFIKGMSEAEGCEAYRETIYDRAEGSYDALGKIWMDDAVGALLTALEDNGQLENTIFLFQNDHGTGPKGTIYEGGVRIPQFVHYPAGIAPGTTFDGLVSTIDVAATMLDYAGISKAPYPLDGKSWKNILGNPDSESYWKQDRCLFFENEQDRAVRCGCYKYMDVFDSNSKTYRRGNRVGLSYDTGGLLFDLCDGGSEYVTDPNNNREINDVDKSDYAAELREVLDCHLKHTDPHSVPDVSVCGATIPPTSAPTSAPTSVPTGTPTIAPSIDPTSDPTSAPTSAPTTAPSIAPTESPSASPVALVEKTLVEGAPADSVANGELGVNGDGDESIALGGSEASEASAAFRYSIVGITLAMVVLVVSQLAV